MPVFVVDTAEVTVPPWITTLDSFLDWRESDAVDENARVWFLEGQVWVDLSMEQVYTHVDVKSEFVAVLRPLAKAEKLGRVLSDGVLLVNRTADISGEPDAMFVSHATAAAGRVQSIEGKRDGVIALEGTPDLVLEVVSDSSERKDFKTLREAYWKAGIPEYWLVDARETTLAFDILKRGQKGYVETKKSGGWLKSAVMGKSFRLVQGCDPQGHPDYTLEVK